MTADPPRVDSAARQAGTWPGSSRSSSTAATRLSWRASGPQSSTTSNLGVTGDRGAEVRRLVGVGASIRQQFEMHTWMRDPEGNDFCVVDV
jgi:Glyoxalase-like domain